MYAAGIVGAVLFVAAAPAAAQILSVKLNYPPAQLIAGIQGTASFEVDLAKDGKVTKCKITQTSGNAELDSQTCIQLLKTGRFKPAVDLAGRPIISTYSSKLRWSIPRPVSEPLPSPDRN